MHCDECSMSLCTVNGCDEDIHKGKRHKRTPLQTQDGVSEGDSVVVPNCEFCDEMLAELYCEDCCMYLCTDNGCNDEVHKTIKSHQWTYLFEDNRSSVGSE